MEHSLTLDRPLAIIDVETTGLVPELDRIVEIAIVKMYPEGKRTKYHTRVNPGIPIPPEATEVHGIHDQDVKDEPRFSIIAPKVAEMLEDCDIAGFNISTYDLPMLQQEFKRAGVEFSAEGRAIVDAMRIYHMKEPRDLEAACHFYLGEEHKHAHSALEDAHMTLRVLEAQLQTYEDLPRDPAGLQTACSPPKGRYLDSGRKFEWRHRQTVFAFGRYRGRFLKDIARDDPGYLEWMDETDFPAGTKKIVREAMNGKFPKQSC